MPAAEVIGYISGFFDGEGYVSIRRSNKTKQRVPSYRIIVGFTNKDRTLLMWIQSIFGGAIYKKVHKNPHAAPAYELIFLNRQEVATLLATMKPFVRIKARQIQLAEDFLALGHMKKLVVGRGKRWPLFRVPPEEVQIREDFKTRMTDLNKRGVDECLQ